GMVPVLAGLYVGGAESCSSPEALSAAGVVAVLTVDAEEPRPAPPQPPQALSSRPRRRVNPGFQGQLKLYEAMGCAVDTSSVLYKRYRLEMLSERFSEPQDLPREVFAVDPTTICQNLNTEVLYRCRKCRRALFRSSSILSHMEGIGPTAFAHKRITDSARLSGNGQEKCTSYFIEPVQWMEPALLGVMEGQLLCPKCMSKLGSFSWRGDQCSCGRWVTPAFQIHKSRVDEVRTLPVGNFQIAKT
ncbi:DUS12 phosphatase, partial [Cinclus mexicanus]|nr:DUS12 phosphatase [Cinclus mexicanus]